jgi:hypothetical protein
MQAGTEIGEDRRTDRVVLCALPEEERKLGCQPDSAGGQLEGFVHGTGSGLLITDSNQLYDHKNPTDGSAWLRENNVD